MTTITKEPNRWWTKLNITCPCCEAEFKLSDTSLIIAEQSKSEGKNYIKCMCPICNLDIPLEKPS